jgi:hypothetical protein
VLSRYRVPLHLGTGLSGSAAAKVCWLAVRCSPRHKRVRHGGDCSQGRRCSEGCTAYLDPHASRPTPDSIGPDRRLRPLESLGGGIRRPSPSLVISILAMLVASSGTAYAAFGGTMILGHDNTADLQFSLSPNQGPGSGCGGNLSAR